MKFLAFTWRDNGNRGEVTMPAPTANQAWNQGPEPELPEAPALNPPLSSGSSLPLLFGVVSSCRSRPTARNGFPTIRVGAWVSPPPLCVMNLRKWHPPSGQNSTPRTCVGFVTNTGSTFFCGDRKARPADLRRCPSPTFRVVGDGLPKTETLSSNILRARPPSGQYQSSSSLSAGIHPR